METLGIMRNATNTRDLYQTLMRLSKKLATWPRDLLILRERKLEKRVGFRYCLFSTSGRQWLRLSYKRKPTETPPIFKFFSRVK
jgi:hypothetical protein